MMHVLTITFEPTQQRFSMWREVDNTARVHWYWASIASDNSQPDVAPGDHVFSDDIEHDFGTSAECFADLAAAIQPTN